MELNYAGIDVMVGKLEFKPPSEEIITRFGNRDELVYEEIISNSDIRRSLASLPNSLVVYISGPMTNVDDYESRFENMVSFLSNSVTISQIHHYFFNRANFIYIINPCDFIDVIPKDKKEDYDSILRLESWLIRDFVDLLVVDDSDDLYLKSKGVTAEKAVAFSKKGCRVHSYKTIDKNIELFKLKLDVISEFGGKDNGTTTE